MYKPYSVERSGPIFSKLMFDGTVILVYKFAHKKAKDDATLLNGAYLMGFTNACSHLEGGQRLFESLYKKE